MRHVLEKVVATQIFEVIREMRIECQSKQHGWSCHAYRLKRLAADGKQPRIHPSGQNMPASAVARRHCWVLYTVPIIVHDGTPNYLLCRCTKAATRLINIIESQSIIQNAVIFYFIMDVKKSVNNLFILSDELIAPFLPKWIAVRTRLRVPNKKAVSKSLSEVLFL